MVVINDGVANPPIYRIKKGKVNEIKIVNSYNDDVLLESTAIQNIEIDGNVFDDLNNFSIALLKVIFRKGGGDGEGSLSDWNQVNPLEKDYIKNKPLSFTPSSHGHTPSEVGLNNIPKC